jgi:hypothetical protein
MNIILEESMRKKVEEQEHVNGAFGENGAQGNALSDRFQNEMGKPNRKENRR